MQNISRDFANAASDQKCTTSKIIFAAGWKPRRTTDFISVKLAQTYKIKEIINLTDVDYIYDKDSNRVKNAKSIKYINCRNYIKIIGTKHQLGSNHPLDRQASPLTKKLKIRLISINGHNLKAVENYLTGKKIIGIIILDY